MTEFSRRRIDLGDGVAMTARIFKGGEKTPTICIPGLTRNAADFDDIAPVVAAGGRDVYVVSLRGRGESDRDPNYLNYYPLVYREDIIKALDALGAADAIFLGTSLGGIVTMLTNESSPDRVKAAIINDVGPEFAQEGIERIAGYVGNDAEPVDTIEDAATRIKAINDVAFPDLDHEGWITFARRTFRERADGRWELDYDPAIARAFADAGPAPDLWPAFESLKNKPTLVLRGGLSDLLSMEIIEKMRTVHPNFDYAETPRVGHAPALNEPDIVDAITSFIERVD